MGGIHVTTSVGENPLESWLDRLGANADLTPTANALLRVIIQNPERASYASTRALAAMARIDVSNVTRLAQALGYPGWPEFRAEIRSQYLSTLSLYEVGEHHRGSKESAGIAAAIDADRRGLALLRPDADAIGAIVDRLASAKQRLAIGGGTYGSAAQVLASHCTLAGYPMTFAAEGAPLANGVARLQEGDVLVAFGVWRHYRAIAEGVRVARQNGVLTVVVTDVARSVFTESADHVLLVSSEGSSHVPTMVPSFAIVNVLVSELARRDPAHTQATLKHHESVWEELNLFLR
jgi:DNA-binding MurR/RpiR family transcriptional regulator